MCLLGCHFWVPAIRKPFPNQVQARIPLMVCLFVFTINPLLGTAVQNCCCGIVGTFWACFHMWVMNGIFPGGMKEGMSPTSATAIFGWANFLIFTFLVLWCKCGIGTKMFALATDIGFMLAFLDPKSTVPFSENFTISHRGTAVNVLLATIIGTLAAPLMNLLPYPMDFAYSTMTSAAKKASADTGALFDAVIEYYVGVESSVVVEAQTKHAGALRAELDGMGGAIGVAWWEGFDLGTRGTVRALMYGQLTLLNNIYDKLRAILMVANSEDFGASHLKVMESIRDACRSVATTTRELLNEVTDAAADGDISDSDKGKLQKKVSETREAVKQLAEKFDAMRKSENLKPVDSTLLGENYFVLIISAYARLVCEYADDLCKKTPQPTSLGSVFSAWLTSTWDISAMTERFNMSFTMIHYLALVISWLYSVYVDNWAGGCVITAVFLMSTDVCPNIQAFLNVLNAVILAVVLGTLVFQGTCGTGFGDYILPFAALVLWIVGLYAYFAKSAFLLPCLVFVALTPFRWVTSCPTGDISAGARALWGGMVANILAILIVCGFQYLLAADRADHLATEELDNAWKGIRAAVDALWKHKDATEPMSGVSGHCGTGSGFCASASIEPRMWRTSWKSSLYLETVSNVQAIRLDILMMWFAMAGSDGKPDGIFKHFEKSESNFDEVKKDLNITLEDAHTLSIKMLQHETGHFSGLKDLKTTTGIAVLDNLDGLMEDLNKLSYEKEVPTTMEDDELCQIASVCMLLDCTIKHVAAQLKGTIRCA